MAIAYVATSQGRATSASSLTVSHTIASGSNRVLITGVECQTGDNITGVTYDGVSMTQYVKVNTTVASFYNYFYYLVAPSIKTANIVISASGTRTIIGLSANYTGVDQGTPLEASNSNIATSSSFTVSVTTVTDNAWLIGTARNNSAGTQSAGANTTYRNNNSGDVGYQLYDSNGAKSPAGSYSLNVSFTTSSLYCMLACAIRPSTKIAVDNTGTATATGVTSVTLSSFTISGSNVALFVSVCDQAASGSVTGVTANGTSMTLVDSQAVGGAAAQDVYLYGLYSPSTGNIVATRTGTGDRITICAVSYTGVSSNTAIGSLAKAKGGSTATTLAGTLTTTKNYSWTTMGTYVSSPGDTTTVGTGTSLKRVTGPEIEDHWDTGGEIPVAGSTTINVNNGGSYPYAYVVCEVEPYSAPASQIKTWDAVTQANVKNFLGATNAQTKTWVGVTNV